MAAVKVYINCASSTKVNYSVLSCYLKNYVQPKCASYHQSFSNKSFISSPFKLKLFTQFMSSLFSKRYSKLPELVCPPD